MRTPDTAAQLVQLGQAEFVGAVDDDGVGIGDVYACFDDGGTQQHIVAVLHEVTHHLLQFAFAQLAVGDGDFGFGHQLAQTLKHVFDGIDFIVQEIHLAATLELAHNRFAHRGF